MTREQEIEILQTCQEWIVLSGHNFNTFDDGETIKQAIVTLIQRDYLEYSTKFDKPWRLGHTGEVTNFFPDVQIHCSDCGDARLKKLLDNSAQKEQKELIVMKQTNINLFSSQQTAGNNSSQKMEQEKSSEFIGTIMKFFKKLLGK